MGPAGADRPTTSSSSSPRGTFSRMPARAVSRAAAYSALAAAAAPPSAASTTSRSPSGTTRTASPAQAAADSMTSASAARGSPPVSAAASAAADGRSTAGAPAGSRHGPARPTPTPAPAPRSSSGTARPAARRTGPRRPYARGPAPRPAACAAPQRRPAARPPGGTGSVPWSGSAARWPSGRRNARRCRGRRPCPRRGPRGDARPVPMVCSSTRSSFSGPPTTDEAGADRSRSRCTSPVSRAARRPAHSGAAATTAPEASYSAAHPSTCVASEASSPSGPPVCACRVSSRWAANPAVTARYWSAAIAADTALLMARKGVRRGTSSSGRPSSPAASTSALGVSS